MILNKTIVYIMILVLFFSILHYTTSNTITLIQLNLTVPMKNNRQYIVTNSNTVPIKKNIEIHPNYTNIHLSSSINKDKNRNLNEENWLRKILSAILSILSVISMFIKFLIDLTIIRVPRPTINETGVSENRVVVNPMYMSIVLTLSIALTIVLLLYLSHSNIRLRKRIDLLPAKSRSQQKPLEITYQGLDFRDIRSAILSSFQYLYRLARERLYLDEARTPREMALEFEKIALGDEAWLIVSAFEELKYGGRTPSWITLKDLKEAVNTIVGKIMKCNSQ